MDLLKGKEIMTWTFMGNTRMYQALRDYGDRISRIGLFSFKVNASGEIYESGVSIATGSTMRTYINKWPHIKWLLTVSNDGTNSIFAALRDNTDGAQDTFLSELVRIMEEYDFCDGVDIDLEKGDDYSTATASKAMFKNIYNAVKAYDSTKLVNICLPGMTSVNGIESVSRRVKGLVLYPLSTPTPLLHFLFSYAIISVLTCKGSIHQ